MSVQINEILNLMGRMDNSFGKYMILAESQESKSISAAINLVMKETGYDKKEAEEYVRNDVRAQMPSLRNQITAKFILGATRLLLDGQLDDESVKNQFDTALKYVSNEENINKFDRNLNGLSAQQIINSFSEQVKAEMEKDKSEIDSTEYQVNEKYRIVKINDFEESAEYNQYTSWCVTSDYNMWNHYTNYGIGQFYFCLRDDYQTVEKKEGENCPLDDYGLSMIAVCVDENGRLKSCTSRWNLQENDGMILSTKQLSELLGVNFYSVFKPNDSWRETLSFIQMRLNAGYEPWKLFDEVDEDDNGLLYVKINNKWNVLLEDNKTFLCKKWYDSIDIFVNGFCRVGLNDKYNMINSKGEQVFDRFFDYIQDTDEGCRRVTLKEKENFITQDCRFISKVWFDYACNFQEGFAVVSFKKKNTTSQYTEMEHNFIDENGNYLLDIWLEGARDFVNGLAMVGYNNKENFVDKNGHFLLSEWADRVFQFHYGLALICINKKWNYIDTKGNFKSDVWYDTMGEFFDGYALVVLDGKYNFVDENFNLMFSDLWFDRTGSFNEGFAAVKLNGKWNFIKTDKTYLTPNVWYDEVDDDFDDGIAYVTINGIDATVNCYGEISAIR